jgi:WD40 repeat protein
MSKASNNTDHSLFEVGHQSTDGQINCIEIFKDSNQIVTGSSKGNIDLFEFDTKNIQLKGPFVDFNVARQKLRALG